MRLPATRLVDALLCVGVFAAAALACGGGSPARSAEIAAGPAVATLTAPELFAAYTDNEIRADQRYKGKIIAVSGTVENIGKDIMDTPYITLSAGESSMMSVQAMFDKANESRLASMSKGRQVTVKCQCDGKLGNVLLTGCSLQ